MKRAYRRLLNIAITLIEINDFEVQFRGFARLRTAATLPERLGTPLAAGPWLRFH